MSSLSEEDVEKLADRIAEKLFKRIYWTFIVGCLFVVGFRLLDKYVW